MTTVKLGIARPPAVDKRLLSAEDYEQYQTFVKRWDRGTTFREPPELGVATAIFCVVGVGGFFAALFWADTLPQEEGNRVIPLALALYSAGLVPYVWFVWWSARRWRIKLVAEARAFLHERVKHAPPHADGDDDDRGNPYWWTGNYDPQRYYGSFHGMTPEHREYISNAYEDLDTYESNRPD